MTKNSVAHFCAFLRTTPGGLTNNMKCIIDTHNKEERIKLSDYLSHHNINYEVNDDNNFHLIVINNSTSGYIGVISAHDLVKNHGYKHYLSIDEYIEEEQ